MVKALRLVDDFLLGTLILLVLGIGYWFFFNRTPYDSWPMEDAQTHKHFIQNAPEITISDIQVQSGLIGHGTTVTARNGFAFPVGKITLKLHALDKTGAVISEREASSSPLNAEEKGRVTFYMLPGETASVKVIDAFAYEP